MVKLGEIIECVGGGDGGIGCVHLSLCCSLLLPLLLLLLPIMGVGGMVELGVGGGDGGIVCVCGGGGGGGGVCGGRY